MALKHTLAAGITAFALLVTPIGLTAQWNDHGPALSTTPAISVAHAASNRPTTKKPPTNGGPTFTSNGTTQKTTGFQTRSGGLSDTFCQTIADTYDDVQDQIADANATGDTRTAAILAVEAEKILSEGMDDGCAFIL